VFNRFRTPILERYLKQEVIMDNKFTLKEFVFFARHFLLIEELLLKNLFEGKATYKQELVAILDRLQRLEEWFFIRQSDYLALVRTEFSLLEKEMCQSLVDSADENLTSEQITTLMSQRLTLIHQSLDEAEEVIEDMFLKLNSLVLDIKLDVYNKFPS